MLGILWRKVNGNLRCSHYLPSGLPHNPFTTRRRLNHCSWAYWNDRWSRVPIVVGVACVPIPRELGVPYAASVGEYSFVGESAIGLDQGAH